MSSTGSHAPTSDAGIDVDDCLELMRLCGASLSFVGRDDGGIHLSFFRGRDWKSAPVELEESEGFALEAQIRRRFPNLFEHGRRRRRRSGGAQDWVSNTDGVAMLPWNGHEIAHKLACADSHLGLLSLNVVLIQPTEVRLGPPTVDIDGCHAWLGARREAKAIALAASPACPPSPAKPRL